MSKQQTYANHARIDPAYHYVLLPILLANIVIRIVRLVHHVNFQGVWGVVLACALFLLAETARRYALRVQDRVIRMEERVRIAAVASPETLARMDDFTPKQIVALRFATWAELGPLADRALVENLTPKQIKQAIQVWRPDTLRV